MWSPRDSSDLCPVCNLRKGEIRVQDGVVCGECMPAEYLDKAASTQVRMIMTFARTHPSYPNCAAAKAAPSGPTVSGDRSMGITQNDPVVLADEINAQMATAGDVDLVVSFIKMSGLNLIVDGIRAHEGRGKVRVITTAYMGATEYDAVRELVHIPGVEVRMELDVRETRLHAKSFIFHRPDGGSTAYVGSANISKPALTTGEEWVVKIREQDAPCVLADLDAGFGALWGSPWIEAVGPSGLSKVQAALENGGR